MTVTAIAEDHARQAYETLADAYDDLTAHHRYEEWTATLERLAEAAGLRGRRLLDVACGTGKSFAPFLARGYEVTACDVSPAMVQRAAARAAARARVLVCDMRTLPRLGAFDLVTCLDDALNYLLTGGELAEALRGLRRNLAVGGVAVFDTNTLATYRGFFAELSVLPGERQVLVWQGRTRPDLAPGGHAHATVEILRAGADGAWTRTCSHHHQRHHPERAVRAALEAAGLRCAGVYGMRPDGSTRAGFDELESSKVVWVATP